MHQTYGLLIFFSVLSLTILSGATAVGLSLVFPEPSDHVKDQIQTFMWLTGVGYTAVVGSLALWRFDLARKDQKNTSE